MTVSASATTTGKGEAGPRTAGPRPGGANVRQRYTFIIFYIKCEICD